MGIETHARDDLATLIITGPDNPGLASTVTSLISRNEGNIVSLDQYTTNPKNGDFFQRIVFHRADLAAAEPDIRADLEQTLEPYSMSFRLNEQRVLKRMPILVSKSDHCLVDLLWRHRRGELPVTIPLVISNHTSVADEVRGFGIPFFHVPSQGSDKSAAESKLLDILKGNADFIVLARYMQILSEGFLDELGIPVINIHHSFLPAFIGAAPYRKAKERGVKLIGATSHYVTADLDEGPIIEQNVTRVDHSMSAEAMQAKGAYVEREVLSKAVRLHAEDRVIRHGNQTIVFD
jgi:formyltetrahydrofolate deformylase